NTCNLSVPPHTHTIYLHDALPICIASTKVRYTGPGVSHMVVAGKRRALQCRPPSDDVNRSSGAWSHDVKLPCDERTTAQPFEGLDRKSTRLNSSHVSISYAVFCLK